MEFGYKIWIEKDGDNVFGMGIYHLLSLVEETGSLHKAAQELKMSYRAAWGKVRDYEKRMGAPLLEKGRHGRTGAHLTPQCKLLMEHFKRIMEEMEKLVASGPLTDLIEKIDKIEPS
ncbi:MAG TPA: LysR family transcriptional regulator [Deltaproteobacteria bacterium]|nr:LysR family transcriptional regulator [Deltaproteobacteria bacterium]